MDRRSLLTVATGAVGAAAASRIPASAAPPTHAGQGRRPVAAFNVISDIQGDLRDLGVALEDMHRTNPTSAGLAVAGDITPRGYDAEYAAVTAELARHTHAGTVALAIGNHEFYVPKWRDPSTLSQETWPNDTTEDSLFRSFYGFAGRNTVYAEHSFGGIPVLSLGTEKYMHYHDPELWDEVWLSEAQFTRISLAKRKAFPRSRVKSVAVSPNGVSLASSRASSNESALRSTATGPKISSRRTRLSEERWSSTDGLT